MGEKKEKCSVRFSTRVLYKVSTQPGWCLSLFSFYRGGVKRCTKITLHSKEGSQSKIGQGQQFRIVKLTSSSTLDEFIKEKRK